MATLMYCPACKTSREATKKGKNAAGEQLWVCKTCNKRFAEGAGTLPVPKKEVKKTSVKNDVKKTSANSKNYTKIYVNNNMIKEVNKTLTSDEAFELVSSYFREISKDSISISDSPDGVRIIKFVITVGTKG
jgi:ribosomal protein L37AE/L43A